MNMPTDYEKNALVNMLQEAIGREIQLRAALSAAQAEISRLTAPQPPAE